LCISGFAQFLDGHGAVSGSDEDGGGDGENMVRFIVGMEREIGT